MNARRIIVGLLAGAALAAASGSAAALDLLDAWRSAERHDLELAAARAARQAGDARRAQSTALWRPTVQATGTAGWASSNSATRGAQFSTPAFGTSNDVAFNTSINSGTTERWAVVARQPLIGGEREVQTRSLALAADAAELSWQAAQQALMLRTAERYFDVVLGAETLRVLQRQRASVEKSLVEVRDRHQLGDIPVTDTYEASARFEAIKAQVLAIQTDLAVRHQALADVTGIDPRETSLAQPLRAVASVAEPLDRWVEEATAGNPALRLQLVNAQVAQEEVKRHGKYAAATLDLVAQYGRDHIAGSGDFGSANNTMSAGLVGVQLNVPLYTGGYRSAKQDEAASLAMQARTEADVTRLRVLRDTRAAWLGLSVGQGRLAALEESRKAAEARLDATRLAQQIGDRTTLDLLNAENDAANASLAVLQARIGLALDRLRLAMLAGRLGEAELTVVNATLQVGEAGDPARQ